MCIRDRIAIVLVASWELMARTGLISAFLAPAPSTVARTIVEQFSSGQIIPHLAATLYRVSFSLVIGGSVGIAAGLLMGMVPRLRTIADPFVSAMHPLPKIAILPIVMAVLGIGDTARIAVISLGVFFPMMINTMGGVKQISRTHLDVARNYGAKGFKLFTRVVLPASLPMVLTGLRIALNLGLLITITTEIAGATVGLGALIWTSWEVMRMEVAYAALIVIMVLGILFNVIVKELTNRFAPWSVEGSTFRVSLPVQPRNDSSVAGTLNA